MKKATTLLLIFFAACSIGYSQSDVRITFIDPGTTTVTLTNIGDATINVASHWLCNWPAYDQISSLSVISGSVIMTAGSSVSLIWSDLNGADGECGYYNTNSFGSTAAMIDYVEWGSTGHFRSSVAVAAGVWFNGDFVPNNQPHSFVGGQGDYGDTFWELATEKVRITKVDLEYGLIELTNFGSIDQGVGGWFFCNFPQYDLIANSTCIIGDFLLSPGESAVFHWEDLVGADGELGLYNANAFDIGSAMEDYMEWGSTGHFRSSLAVSQGHWVTGDFVPHDSPYTFMGGGDDVGDDFWTFRKFGCTYPEAANFDPEANADDGSCDLSGGPECVGDLDGDLQVNTSDLLVFLGVFGNNCQ